MLILEDMLARIAGFEFAMAFDADLGAIGGADFQDEPVENAMRQDQGGEQPSQSALEAHCAMIPFSGNHGTFQRAQEPGGAPQGRQNSAIFSQIHFRPGPLCAR